jgi:hypothetical protein
MGRRKGRLAILVIGSLLGAAAARAADQVYGCTPANVAVFDNRIHVNCTVANASGIQYFAVPTADRDRANRTLALLLAAISTGATVGVHFDPNDLSGSAIGCANADCRLITWAFMLPPP